MKKRGFSKKQSARVISANSVSMETIKSNLTSSHLGRREFLRVSALGTAGATLSFAPGLFSDKIMEEWDFPDMLTLMQQIGAIPSGPPKK